MVDFSLVKNTSISQDDFIFPVANTRTLCVANTYGNLKAIRLMCCWENRRISDVSTTKNS